MDSYIQSLEDLGFTGLEAEVYTALLKESPSTGYRIAQIIGKPAANVYKSIQSLEVKGAVLIDESTHRFCRAIPVRELLDQLERQFRAKKQRADTLMAHLIPPDEDDRVYQLKSPDQVIERCRRMLNQAREIVVIDAFPAVLEQFGPDIENAVKRSVRIAVNVYRPWHMPGAEIFEREDGEKIISRWPGEWINMVADGETYLIGLLDRAMKQVIQAVWSASPYLSWVYHSALIMELQFGPVRKKIIEGVPTDKLQALIRHYDDFFPLNAPGYRKLMERFHTFNSKEGS
ncbi:TrmB family transcriptional regulator [bacterium]|nr:TrmB family transcriptional regulator [bacterium]